MDEDKSTHSCQITKAEIAAIIEYHSREIVVNPHTTQSINQNNIEERIDRLNYLMKRLKDIAKKVPEIKTETANQGWPNAQN